MKKIAIIGTGMRKANLERFRYLLSIQTSVFVIEPLIPDQEEVKLVIQKEEKIKPDHSYKTVQKKNKFFE
jgi:siroheme synthase (precorrin-2 oxidase/ferrochelatase)